MRRVGANSDGKKDPLNIEFLGFVAQTLAHLPYDVQEEPLFIIYTIFASAYNAALHSEVTGGGAEAYEEVFA